MGTLEPINAKNNFSFMGIQQKIEENPTYIHVYDFEKLDFAPIHHVMTKHFHLLYVISLMYLATIFTVKRWMEKRERYELRKPLFWWNVFLAGLSMIMLSRLLPEILYNIQTYGFYRSYCKRDHSNSATMFWSGVFLFSKTLEFADTMFILLRKQPLTFLHVFHHTSVFIACAYGLLGADPAGRYFQIMNCFVHAVMYSYYALKAAQFKLPRKLAMMVTAVQLLQFATIIFINVLVVYHKNMRTKPTCDRPDDITTLFFGLGVVYFIMFGNFFLDSYVRGKPGNPVKTKEQ